MAITVFFATFVLVFRSQGQVINSMLADAVHKGKAYTVNGCLAKVGRELNWGVVPKECHHDMQQFYCQKVNEVTSKRYKKQFAPSCKEHVRADIADLIPTPHEVTSIGYIILSHQYAENVKRLIMRLYEPGTTTFAIHVDVKNGGMALDLENWARLERMNDIVRVYSEFNVVRGGSAMLKAELQGMRVLLNSTIPWKFCILLSEQDYPLRSNRVLADWLWVHRSVSFISVDEGECERDMSFQCGDRVVSMSGGVQYPKVPGMRYGSGSQWFTITRELAATVVKEIDKPTESSVIGAVYQDLVSVKQPDESFFQTVILNTELCAHRTDYVMHWTDKDSFREIRSETSAYNILSPGVLGSGKDYEKLAEVRAQSLWAFFARKFDNSTKSEMLRDKLDANAGENSLPRWQRVGTPSAQRLVEVLVSSFDRLEEVERVGRNKDGLFVVQTFRMLLSIVGRERYAYVREKWTLPVEPGPVLSLRVGCGWNKTELVFEGDVSIVDNGEQSCESLWAVVHWRMSRKPVTEEVVLSWIDRLGTTMQQVPMQVSEQSVVLWHRYTATVPLPEGRWKLDIKTMSGKVIARRSFYVYKRVSDIPWAVVEEFFDVTATDPMI